MNRRLRSLTDEELVQRYKHRRWENEVQGIGCSLSLYGAALAVILWAVIGPDRPWIPLGVLLVAFLIGPIARWIATLRPRPYVRELRRRYGQLIFQEQIEDASREMSADSRQSHIILFQGRAVGQTAYIRVAIENAAPPRAAVDFRIGADIRFTWTGDTEATHIRTDEYGDHLDPVPWGYQFTRHSADLLPDEASALLESIAEHGDLKDAANINIGGYDCCVAVLQNHPIAISQGCCDLFYLSEDEAAGATAALAHRLLAIAGRLSDSPLILGWEVPHRETGHRSFDAYVAEARSRLSEASAPDWILLLKGISVSCHLQYALVRIMLYANVEISAHLEVVTSPKAASILTFGVGQICEASVDLGIEDSEDLLRFLDGLSPNSLHDVPTTIRRGYPCLVAAIRKEPPLELRGSCDLLGTAAADANDTTALLIRRIMALAERASSSPMIQGWGEYARDTLMLYPEGRLGIFSSSNSTERMMDADWVVVLTIEWDPPYFTGECIRIELSGSIPPSGRVITVRTACWSETGNPPARVSTRRELRPDEAESLLTRLRGLKPGDLATIPSTVKSGAPCTIIVLRLEPRGMQSGECNLATLLPEQEQTPMPTLIRQLIDLARKGGTSSRSDGSRLAR